MLRSWCLINRSRVQLDFGSEKGIASGVLKPGFKMLRTTCTPHAAWLVCMPGDTSPSEL